MSILIEALIEAMDEYYSINLAEEVKRGMTEKATRGGVVSVAPFGYRNQNGTLVPDPENSEGVRRIFQQFLDGSPYRTIASEMNSLGSVSYTHLSKVTVIVFPGLFSMIIFMFSLPSLL